MKYCLLAASVLVFVTGCGAERKATREFNTLSELYRSKMDAGKTKPEQDKEYIRAIARLGFELDRAVRGTKAAEKTRQDARIMGGTGIDPNSPLRIPSERDPEIEPDDKPESVPNCD
jgi:hypothetical protein